MVNTRSINNDEDTNSNIDNVENIAECGVPLFKIISVR
jgi:hypothetical protein